MSSLFTTPLTRAWLGTGLAGALLLVACGGGGDGPQISNISAANARYTGTVTLTVSGARLDEGIAMSIEGPCETLTTVLGGSSDTRQFTCDVTAIGDFIATVARTDGGVIGRLTVNVPRPRVEVTTNLGNFVVELDPEKAPATSVNFLGYVNANFYTSVLVHGADPARGILAGGYRTGLRAKTAGAGAFALESNNGLKNLRGTLAMYRDSAANSARAQWFINTADNPSFDRVDDANPGYAVFGTVVSGLSVVDAISAVPTKVDAATGLTNAPVTEVLITDATQTR
jgi:cyclophilin family peptidyl-prolyl cis-trans isomerase